MDYKNVEHLIDTYLESHPDKYNKKKIYNLKYRIKNGWDNHGCKVSTDFKEYIKKNSLWTNVDDIKESIDVNSMTDEDRKKYILEKHTISVKTYTKTLDMLKSKLKKNLKKHNVSNKELFKTYFKYDGELVKLVDIDYMSDENNYYLDGRITYPLGVMLIEIEEFDKCFFDLYNLLNIEFDLDCTYDNFTEILQYYYNCCRTEFEILKTDEIKHMRQTQKDMMPKRELGDSYKDWIKKMRNSGFYCGWCDEHSGNAVPDLNAWIFLGKKLMSHLQKFRKKYDIENAENGCSPRNVYLSKMSFVEIQFNCDRPEDFKKQPKIWFSGYNGMNITPTNILSMKKRFQDQFINRKLYNLLSWYGEE